MRVAKLIRKEVLEKKYHFNGSLRDKQYDDLPVSLSALVGMILGGSNAGQRIDDNEVSTAASFITQLLVFNAVKRGRTESVTVRHNSDRETVLPLYLRLIIHNRTRKRDLIDILFEKGLSVSYDRVLQLSTEEANRVIDNYENEGSVCLSTLTDKLFTTGNLDNIDHNPSSTLSLDSFHGTAISITQHITNVNPGVFRVLRKIPENRDQPKSKSIKSLPKSYTNVPPILLLGNVIPTVIDDLAIPIPVAMNEDQMQMPWFEKVRTALADENQTDLVNMNISWGGGGGLHIEMAMLKVIGDWLDGSGWTHVMTSANVATEGRAAGIQKSSHTSRGQWAHQVTAAALFILLHRSYDEYQKEHTRR